MPDDSTKPDGPAPLRDRRATDITSVVERDVRRALPISPRQSEGFGGTVILGELATARFAPEAEDGAGEEARTGGASGQNDANPRRRIGRVRVSCRLADAATRPAVPAFTDNRSGFDHGVRRHDRDAGDALDTFALRW